MLNQATDATEIARTIRQFSRELERARSILDSAQPPAPPALIQSRRASAIHTRHDAYTNLCNTLLGENVFVLCRKGDDEAAINLVKVNQILPEVRDLHVSRSMAMFFALMEGRELDVQVDGKQVVWGKAHIEALGENAVKDLLEEFYRDYLGFTEKVKKGAGSEHRSAVEQRITYTCPALSAQELLLVASEIQVG